MLNINILVCLCCFFIIQGAGGMGGRSNPPGEKPEPEEYAAEQAVEKSFEENSRESDVYVSNTNEHEKLATDSVASVASERLSSLNSAMLSTQDEQQVTTAIPAQVKLTGPKRMDVVNSDTAYSVNSKGEVVETSNSSPRMTANVNEGTKQITSIHNSESEDFLTKSKLTHSENALYHSENELPYTSKELASVGISIQSTSSIESPSQPSEPVLHDLYDIKNLHDPDSDNISKKTSKDPVLENNNGIQGIQDDPSVQEVTGNTGYTEIEAQSRTPSFWPNFWQNLQRHNAKLANNPFSPFIILFLIFVAVLCIRLFVHAYRRKPSIIRSKLLKFNMNERKVKLRQLISRKSDITALENALLSVFRDSKEENIRFASIETLFALADISKSSQNYVCYLDMALRDIEKSIRQSGCDMALSRCNSNIIERLKAHLSIERESNIRDTMTKGILLWQEQKVREAISANQFVEAQKGISTLLVFGCSEENAAKLTSSLEIALKQKVNVENIEALNKRKQEAVNLTIQSAKKIAESDCKAGEELIRAALSMDPTNDLAIITLGMLPQLREQLQKADNAKKQADIKLHTAKLRKEIETKIANHDFGGATTLLLEIAGLDPADEWYKTMLQKIPSLQADYQKALESIRNSERAAKIHELEMQLHDHWHKNELDQALGTAKALQQMLPGDAEIASMLTHIMEDKRRQASENAWNKIEQALQAADLFQAESILKTLPCLDDFDKNRSATVLRGLTNLRNEIMESTRQKARLARFEKGEKLRLQAAELLTQGNLDQAEETARKLISLIPEDEGAQALARQISSKLHESLEKQALTSISNALKKGDIPLAEKVLQESLTSISNKTRLDLILEKLPVLRTQEQERKLAEEAKEKESQKKLLLDKLRDFFDKGNWNEAEQIASQLIAQYPADQNIAILPIRISEARNNMKAEKIWQDLSEAMKASDWKAIEVLLPSLFVYEPHKERAEQLLRKLPGLKAAAAQKTAEMNQQKKEKEIQSLIDKAAILQGQGDFTGAISKLDEAISIAPGNNELISLRSAIQEKMRQKNIANLTQQIQENLHQGNFDTAEGIIRSLLPITDNPDPLLKALDNIPELRRKQQYSVAVTEEVNAQGTAAKNLKDAQTSFTQGKMSEAASKLRKAIALDPTNDRAAKLLERVFQFDSVISSRSSGTQYDSYGQIITPSSDN